MAEICKGPTARQDADRLVSAWNNHEDLLTACRAIRDARDRHAEDGRLPDGYDAIDDYMADTADAAIRKVEGESENTAPGRDEP